MTLYHKHHIIPKHMGGTDDPSNIVELTVEEHAEAHRVLYEKYGRWQDKLAWQGLAGMIGKEEIIRQKNSESGKKSKGRPKSEEHRLKISEANKGKIVSKETRRKLSEAQKGKPHSEETKRKMSEAKKGESNHFFGKKHSEETKRKISEARKGQVPWNKGKTGICSEETKRKISEAKIGKTHTEETKRKLSEAAKKHWAKKRSKTE